ncbi:MAG: hypothetical protein ACM336_21440 [Acidobacteriota bacterium]
MKFEMKGIGTGDRKKVYLLAGLGLVLAYFVYTNVIAPDDAPARSTRSAATADPAPRAPAAGVFGTPVPDTRRTASLRPEFKMGARNNRPDPASIDPTLRLDLLAKVQSVNLEGGTRNLFQFGASPMPRTPEPKIVPRPGGAFHPGMPGGLAQNAATGEPVKAAPPPIPLRFYGYSSQSKHGEKRAFFLADGDEIVVAAEGELIKGRYKVVRIDVNSALVEDVQFKNQQTLTLEEQAG